MKVKAKHRSWPYKIGDSFYTVYKRGDKYRAYGIRGQKIHGWVPCDGKPRNYWDVNEQCDRKVCPTQGLKWVDCYKNQICHKSRQGDDCVVVSSGEMKVLVSKGLVYVWEHYRRRIDSLPNCMKGVTIERR